MGENDSIRSYCKRYLRPQIGCLLKDLSRLQDIVQKQKLQSGKRFEAGDTPITKMPTNDYSLKHGILDRYRFGRPCLCDDYNRRPRIGERSNTSEDDFNLTRRDSAFRSLVFERMSAVSKLRAEREAFIRDKRMLMNDLKSLKSAVDLDRDRRAEEEARWRVLSRELECKSSVLNKAQASLEELSSANRKLRDKLGDLQKMEEEITRLKESRDISKKATERRLEDLSSQISSLNRRLGVANERLETLQQERDDLLANNSRLLEKNTTQRAEILEMEDRIERKRKSIFESKDHELKETAKKLQNAVSEIKSLEHELWQSKEDVELARKKRQECLDKLAEEDDLRRQTEEDLRKAKDQIDLMSQKRTCLNQEHVLQHHEKKELHQRIDHLRHTLRVQERASMKMKKTLQLLNVDVNDFEHLAHVSKMQKTLEEEWNRMSCLEEKWKKINHQCDGKKHQKLRYFNWMVHHGINITLLFAVGYFILNYILPVFLDIMSL